MVCDTLKTCPHCGLKLPKTSEYFYSSKRYGFQSWCKSCCRLGAGWSKIPKDEKAWRTRKSTFKRVHGIELSDAQLAKALETKVCEICGKEATGRSLHLDHNHNTKVVRGSLCRFCNTTLGYAKDSVEYLESMIRYLKKYEN